MLFPEVVILAQGGTHGDFLYSCCQIMQGKSPNKVDKQGRVIAKPELLVQNWEKQFGTNYKKQYADLDKVEIAHIWKDEFINWPSKFFYIRFTDKQLPVIKKMFIAKVCNGSIDTAIKKFNRSANDYINKKVNKNNMLKVLDIHYKKSLQQYKKQPGIQEIKIMDLYNRDSLNDVLFEIGIFNKKYVADLEKFHTNWLDKNKHFINMYSE